MRSGPDWVIQLRKHDWKFVNLKMEESRRDKIEDLASQGNLGELKELLGTDFTQDEIDLAFADALAYSQIGIAEYLLSLGADISWENYYGVYNAVFNNEMEGLLFAMNHGAERFIREGKLLNKAIVAANKKKDTTILIWLIENGADITQISDGILNAFGTKEIKEICESRVEKGQSRGR